MVSISVTSSASPSFKPSPARSWTTITSITTATVHPTYLFTLTESEPVSDFVTSSAFVESSQTSRSAVDTHPIVGTPTPTTLDTSTTFEESSTIMTSVKASSLSAVKPLAPLAHLSDFTSLENALSMSTSTYFGQPEATTSSPGSISFSIMTSVLSSTTTSTSPTISPFLGTVTGTISSDKSTSSTTAPSIGPVSSPISTDNSTTSSNSTESTSVSNTNHGNAIKPAMIVGIIIGASAFIMFALAACFVLRRRRRKIMRMQKIIGARMGHPSLGPGLGYETLHVREAATPADTKTSQVPTLPVIPEEAHTVPAYSNGPFTHAHSNPDLSMDNLYLRSERSRRAFYTQNAVSPSQQSEHSHPLTIEVCPPSREPSTYSRSSWEDASVEIIDFYGASTSTLPHEHDGGTFPPSNAKYLEACMSRDSLRSDPFDLEAPSVSNPPGSPPVPPVPTDWGTKF
ncbi:hypothetical protein N7508_010061 [Penicillium antarcticum]|uniref:uncharacterized protein n=1 Tax=Penicillium antarcticum TaxID=416450 RepID=UPI0023A178FC|nr:uncharacterized protein N7508_010061 [Penicillium antarcticum]KAJ5295240.1 hypothetical protein N7508_010061 [Penicillium antarcticum]